MRLIRSCKCEIEIEVLDIIIKKKNRNNRNKIINRQDDINRDKMINSDDNPKNLPKPQKTYRNPKNNSVSDKDNIMEAGNGGKNSKSKKCGNVLRIRAHTVEILVYRT